MARQDVNEALLETSFLYGGNAAYIEELQAAYARNPSSVDPEWQSFFKGLGEDETLVEKNAAGASWTKPNWPVPANGEIVSALDGNWATLEKAVGEKILAKGAEGARRASRGPASPPTASRSPPGPACRWSRRPRIRSARSC